MAQDENHLGNEVAGQAVGASCPIGIRPGIAAPGDAGVLSRRTQVGRHRRQLGVHAVLQGRDAVLHLFQSLGQGGTQPR